MSAAQRATQVERSRAKESRGRSGPAGQRGDEGARHVAPVGLGPAHDEPAPAQAAAARARGGQLGAHGHDARPAAAHADQHPAGARDDVVAA